MAPNDRRATPAKSPPHPATVTQPRPAFGERSRMRPHPATVAQPRPAFGERSRMLPHPAARGSAARPPSVGAAQRSIRFVRKGGIEYSLEEEIERRQREAELELEAEAERLGVCIGQAMLDINTAYDAEYLRYPGDIGKGQQTIAGKNATIPLTTLIKMQGTAPTAYFKRIETMSFQCLSNVSPTDAIEAFADGPTVCECLSSAQASLFLGIARFMGRQSFDAKFAQFIIPGSFYALQTGNSHILSKNLVSVPKKNTRPGDWTVILNHPDYNKNCGGSSAKFNLICYDVHLGHPRWSGLGVKIPTNAGHRLYGTQAEIEEFLVQEYIKDFKGNPKPDAAKLRLEFENSKTAGKVTAVKRLNWAGVIT